MAAAFRMEYPPDRALTAADEQRLFRCTMDLAKEVLGRVADVRAVPQDRAAFAAVLKFPASAVADGAADAAAVQAAGKARELAANYFSVDLAVGLGERCAGSAAIADSYDEARRALEAAAAEGRVVEFRRLRGQIRTGGDDGSGSLIAALEEALGRRSAESFRSAMDAVLRQLRGRIVHLPDALDICCRVRQTILARMDGDEELLDSFFPAEGDGCKCLFRAAGVDGLAVWLETLRDGLAAELADRAAKRHDPRSRRIVVAVKKHLAERYAESLSLAAVAERFRISPNYLSSVFKRHEGIGFAEYLSELRIAQAKRLIGQRGLKVYEIAALVGFEDAFYFSKVFKRVCGLTPSEYEARVDSGG
jgi:two-component system response regulator YesN